MMKETRDFDTENMSSYDVDEFVREFIACMPAVHGTLKVILEFHPQETTS